MPLSIGDLMNKCEQKGIVVDPLIKDTKRSLLELLASHTISKENVIAPYCMAMRMQIEVPSLCFPYKNLKASEQLSVMHGPKWIAEPKWDGCRIIIAYHPKEGFRFYSRGISTKNFLPLDYTNKILLITKDRVVTPSSQKGIYPFSMLFDAEVVVNNAYIDTTTVVANGTRTKTKLNAVSAILAVNAPASHRLQIEQATLSFKLFDCMTWKGLNIKQYTLNQRRNILEYAVKYLSNIGALPFEISPWIRGKHKRKFWVSYVGSGGEGVVFKNIYSPYIDTGARKRTCMVKLKRSVDEEVGEDIDCFVTGFTLPDADKSWSHLIGSIELSVNLITDSGAEIKHYLCSVSSMPLSIREGLTELDEEHKPRLRKEFYGRVLTVSGQAISSKNRRLTHATADWSRGFRADKNSNSCKMEEKFLCSNML